MCCPFVAADFPGSHYFGVPLSAVHITPAPLVLCGTDLPVVVSEDVTADAQAIRFFHSFLSFLSVELQFPLSSVWCTERG